MLETLVAQNTAPDGWRPAYDREFISRSGWIFLGVAGAFILASQVPGKAAFFAAVYAVYFLARAVEHAWVRAQFWLSATAFAVAAVAAIVPTYLFIDRIAAAVMAVAVILSVAFGVGRRIHPSWAMVSFAVPLALWCLDDPRMPWSFERPMTAAVVALAAVGVALFVLSLSRRDARHALAERIGGQVRLDSGEVYAMDRGRVLRLGSRLEPGPKEPAWSRSLPEPGVRFTVFTGPRASTASGRVWIGHRGSERLPPSNGSELHRTLSELHRTLGGVPFRVAFEHPSALTEALASGFLDGTLTRLARLRDPFVFIGGDELRIETTSRGTDVEEALVAVGRAFGAKTETTPSGIYR